MPSMQLEPAQEPTGSDWSIINTDAAWSTSRSCLSLHHPLSPPTISWFQSSQDDTPIQVEDGAALLALSIAAEREEPKIWLRCDALILVDAILHPFNSPWKIRSIFLDIIRTLNSFSDWICSWIPRSDNTLAHDLGQFGSKFNLTSLCMFQGNSKLSYASAMTKGAQVELTGPAILGAELLTMIKQMAQLEERMVSQSKKEAGMPTDKKQMLSSAMSRTEPLEEPKSYFHD
ncbi:hypothetical protein CDL15_Pgr019546 [Punica granatum]|uniref:RNase H type-1 domain-containing protein n=1 Tax=Punica granatum TaxID=22663 RepID=A0A218X6E8_PUNGR|nr:hypothetical protein CDL15_Pgr019546 [Punica granatum]